MTKLIVKNGKSNGTEAKVFYINKEGNEIDLINLFDIRSIETKCTVNEINKVILELIGCELEIIFSETK